MVLTVLNAVELPLNGCFWDCSSLILTGNDSGLQPHFSAHLEGGISKHYFQK